MGDGRPDSTPARDAMARSGLPASNGPPFWPVLAGYRNIGGRSAASQAGARAASSSPKTSVCRSTSAAVVAGDISAMLWNGVSSTPRFSAHRCSSCSSSSSTAARGLGAVARWGPKLYSARHPSRLHVPRQRVLRRCAACTPSAQRVRQRRSSARTPRRSAPRSSVARIAAERERVAGEGAADAADVDVVAARSTGASRVGDLRGHAVGRRRDAAADRLADRRRCRARAPRRAVQPPGPGAERVRLVDDQQHAVAAGELAQRRRGSRRRAARCRCWSAPARSAGTRRRRWRAPRSSAVEVVELDDAGGLGRVDRRRRRCPAAATDAVGGVERRERLVDAAVVAAVDAPAILRPAGEVAGEADDVPVGVGRRQGELPLRQPEPAAELLADPRPRPRSAASW